MRGPPITRPFARAAGPYIKHQPGGTIRCSPPARSRVVAPTAGRGPPTASTFDDDRWVRGSQVASQHRPMIRRALLIVATALALSAAGAMAFTPAARAGGSLVDSGNSAYHASASPSIHGPPKVPRTRRTDASCNRTTKCRARSARSAPRRRAGRADPRCLPARRCRPTRARERRERLLARSRPEGASLLPAPALCRAGSATPPIRSGDSR